MISDQEQPCAHTNTIEENGDVICIQCGLVLSDHNIAHLNPIRAFDPEQYLKKTHHSPRQTVRGLGYTFNLTKSSLTPDQYRLYKLDNQKTTSLDHQQAFCLNQLKLICGKLEIPESIISSTLSLYFKLRQQASFKGICLEPIIAVIIFITARIHHLMFSMKEIAQVCNTTSLGMFSIIQRFHHLLPPIYGNFFEFLTRFMNKMHLSIDCQHQITHFMKKIQSKISGKNPRSIIAAGIYLITHKMKMKYTQKQIAAHCGITEVSLRNNYFLLLQFIKTQKGSK